MPVGVGEKPATDYCLRYLDSEIKSVEQYIVQPQALLQCSHAVFNLLSNGLKLTAKNCFVHAQFVVSAQEINPSEVDADEQTTDESNCNVLLAEVLEQQGGGNRLLFSVFCDVNKDVKTC